MCPPAAIVACHGPSVKGGERQAGERQAVEKGQILVEWDPYTFSILTESSGQVRFKDIIDKVTVHEEVDEITGMSRLIIVDSPDEKKQPAIEIVAAEAGDTAAHAKVLNRYHMPSNAHRMVGNNDPPRPIASDRPLPYRFDLPTANHVFLAGHRIMVQVQSQTFVPSIFRATPADFRKATQRIYHAPGQASAIELPVVRAQ